MSTNYSPDFSLEPALNENLDFSPKSEAFIKQFTELYRKIARKVNAKDGGFYWNQEIINDQRYYLTGDPQKFHTIFRKVVPFGALPNAGLKQVAHGITGIGNGYMFTRIYGTAVEPAGVAPRPFYIPLPNGGPNYPVEIMVDNTNINIRSTVNLSTFTTSYIVLEFWKV